MSAAMDIVNAGLAGVEAYSRKRLRGSANQTRLSTTVIKKSVAKITASAESSDEKRLPPVSYRIRPAKYVTGLPSMFKEMFMPTLTSKLSFGFVSNNGRGNQIYGETINTDVSCQAPRGVWRGIALFKARFTNPLIGRASADALNATRTSTGIAIGASSATKQEVVSAYRRYTSSPSQNKAGTASKINQTVCDTLTATPVATNGQLRQLGMGTNLCHLEDHAYQSSNFIQSVSSSSIGTSGSKTVIGGTVDVGDLDTAGGNIGTSNTGTSYDWDGTVPLIQGQYYPPNVRDMVMRISDGFVEMDISNTSKTPCVIELVIHSMKKTDFTTGSQDVYNEIYNSYNYSVNSATDVNPGLGQDSGGWQVFYDPQVPFLKVPSRHDSKVRDLVTEVHRSCHILASGQSKVVKISLGSLYYKLGNKSTFPTQNTSGYIHTQVDALGTLLFAIGHTGVPGFESMGSEKMFDLTGGTLTTGNGFWAGKVYTPSSIAVSGKYQEQYYPMYSTTTERVLGDHYPLAPSTTNAAGGVAPGLPINVLTTQHITTTADTELGRVIGAQATL